MERSLSATPVGALLEILVDIKPATRDELQ